MASIKVEKSLVSLGKVLRDARRRRLMSQKDLADRVGITRQTIKRIEDGCSGVALEKYLTLFLIFNKLDDFNALFNSDEIGRIILENTILPTRIRSKRTS